MIETQTRHCGSSGNRSETMADDQIEADTTSTLLDAALSAMNLCEHDGGFDREIGPIGCALGDKCVCIGVYPLVAKARDALLHAERMVGVCCGKPVHVGSPEAYTLECCEKFVSPQRSPTTEESEA